jgi:hypothetical protein
MRRMNRIILAVTLLMPLACGREATSSDPLQAAKDRLEMARAAVARAEAEFRTTQNDLQIAAGDLALAGMAAPTTNPALNNAAQQQLITNFALGGQQIPQLKLAESPAELSRMEQDAKAQMTSLQQKVAQLQGNLSRARAAEAVAKAEYDRLKNSVNNP